MTTRSVNPTILYVMITLVQFNIENLFIYLDHYQGQDLKQMTEKEWQGLSSSSIENKPLDKIWAATRSIRDMDPDILMLNEVGGLESLENFNQYFLENQYQALITEGNSHRGIDVCYLVHKRLNYNTLLITHKNRPLNFLYPHERRKQLSYSSHYFSRDVSELRFFKKSEINPHFVILLTHLKSKLDPEFIDSEGKLRRKAETKALIEIYKELQQEVQPHTPIIVAGDFNGIASPQRTDEEFTSIYDNTDLIESFDFKKVDLNARMTQTHTLNNDRLLHVQFDYIFFSKSTAPYVLESYVYKFKNNLGLELTYPTNIKEKKHLPSDHYPVVLKLKNLD